MKAQDLRDKIELVLGNSLRCLLPSYWWKNLFHSVADRIDDVEKKVEKKADGVVIVDSEDALFNLNLPKGSVASVAKKGGKFSECYRATDDDLLNPRESWDKFTRIKSIEKNDTEITSSAEWGILAVIGSLDYITGDYGTHRSVVIAQISCSNSRVSANCISTEGSDTFLGVDYANKILGQDDLRFCLISADGVTEEEAYAYLDQAFTINGTSDVYTKGEGWERLAKIGDIPDGNEANGTIVFYQDPELPEETRQLNIEAYNKVSNAIARGKFDFDIKIYIGDRIVNPTFITGSMGVLLFTAESEGYRYVFQCLESGSVTVETKPISGGGDTTANNEVSIITFNMPAEGEVLTEDAKKQNAESYAKIVDAFKERKAYDVKIDLAGFAFNDVDTIWLPSIYQGELVMSFDLSNKSTSTKMLLIVTSDGSVDSTEISSGGTSGDITIDTEMSSTSTNPVQNKVVYSELQKKQDTISDLADIRSGAAKGETAIQKVKTINGESIEGEGNIVIKGEEGGLKYVEERTVYPSKMIADGEEAGSYELSETEKAYNIETLDKAINERSVIIVVAGYILQFVYSKSNTTERIGKFSYVGELDKDLLSVSITINQDGDAIWEQKVLELGEGDETDTSNLATKDELNNLTNEVIANEEVHAAALNDLNERLNEIDENLAGEAVTKEEFNETIEGINNTLEGKANASSTNEAINGLQTSINSINESLSGFATNEALSEEITNLTNEIVANEEVHAAALNDLNERKADKEYVEEALKNIGTSDLASKEELNAVIDRIDDIESSQLGAVTVEQETLIFKVSSSAKIVDNTLIL